MKESTSFCPLCCLQVHVLDGNFVHHVSAHGGYCLASGVSVLSFSDDPPGLCC